MGQKRKRKLAVVFAGNGGTFYHGAHLYAALVAKYQPDLCVFVDDDRVEPKNHDRQWLGSNQGVYKAYAASGEGKQRNWMEGMVFLSRFPLQNMDEREALRAALEGHDVVVVSNVDNNRARCDIREWCRCREGYCSMVVSGCDNEYGQVWTGAWYNQDTIHDWLQLHPETAEGEGKVGGQYGQNAVANAVTGILSGHFLREELEFITTHNWGDPIPELEITEAYWKFKAGQLRVWEDEVVRMAGLSKEVTRG